MSESDRLKYLRVALRALSVMFIVGYYPLTVAWPSGWAWQTGHSEYQQMMIGIYATLGVFVWLASRDPVRHVSLISFAIWSSIVHALIMAVQSIVNAQHVGHLYGDVPVLLVVAAVLAWLSPHALTFRFARDAA